jgi:hypothetical protein
VQRSRTGCKMQGHYTHEHGRVSGVPESVAENVPQDHVNDEDDEGDDGTDSSKECHHDGAEAGSGDDTDDTEEEGEQGKGPGNGVENQGVGEVVENGRVEGRVSREYQPVAPVVPHTSMTTHPAPGIWRL